ncbi:hypothetical protein OKW34_003430 [Paraburkholderia youngii]
MKSAHVLRAFSRCVSDAEVSRSYRQWHGHTTGMTAKSMRLSEKTHVSIAARYPPFRLINLWISVRACHLARRADP